MPNFRYKARDEQNKTVGGVVQAASREVAAEILTDEGLTILSIELEEASLWQRSLKILKRVKIKDLVIFSRQLSVIVSATIPLVQGLKILIQQTENDFFKTIISEVADDVEGGAKLSAALARHPEVFSNFYTSIIKSGETSGKLDEVLNYLADQQEKDYDTISRVRGAMIYPIFILCGLVVVGTMMMIFVIPNLTEILAESGTELPLSTKILIGTSNFLTNFWWLLFLGIIGLVIALKFILKTSKGQYFWDLLKLRLPVFGKLFQKIILVRISRSLYTLMSGGVPISKSLEIVAEVTGNVIFKELILETAREVEGGNSIASAFLKSKEVPAMVSQMLNLGERTGRLDEILEKLTDFYSREIKNMLDNLSSLLEPMILMAMGIAVGLLVSAIILPMYDLAGSI